MVNHPAYILQQDIIDEDGMSISVGKWGHKVTEDYLKKNSHSPDDFSQLLAKAEIARTKGNAYLYFPDPGKFAEVDPRKLL